MRIVVRAPNWLGDIIMSFPFMHALHEEFPSADITVIVKEAYMPLLHFLPFKVKAIPFDKEDHPGLVELYKYCWNQPPLRDADIYFSLPPSFSSAFMGFCLRAKQRVGFSGDYRGIFLTHKKEKPSYIHRSQEYLRLLSLYTEKDYSKYKKIISRDVVPFFTEWEDNRYLVININSEASSRRLPLGKWVELIDQFEEHRIVFIGAAKDKERVEELLGQLTSKNSYVNLVGKTNILELARVLAYAQGVITNDSGPAHLASYVGANVVVFFGAGDWTNTAPNYNVAESLVLVEEIACSPCLKNQCMREDLECLHMIDMAGTFEKIYSFLKL